MCVSMCFYVCVDVSYHEPQHHESGTHHGKEDRVRGVHTDPRELTIQVIVDLPDQTRGEVRLAHAGRTECGGGDGGVLSQRTLCN